MDKNHKLSLTTLTPVFIGSEEGSNLSPITDYIFDHGSVKIIDQKKFEVLLNRDINMVDDFVSQVKNKLYSFDLKDFIVKKLNTSIEQLTKATIEVEGLLSSNTIYTFVSTVGKPFIPGSSIKGAIRTAIIYNYLTNTDKGKIIIEKLLNKASNFFKELNELFEKKKNQKLNDDEYKKFKSLSSYKSNEKEFSKIYNELRLFKDEVYGHDFRHIQISDSETYDLSDTKITELPRTYLTKTQDKTSQWKQVLKDNISREFTLSIKPEIKDNYLSKINNNSLQSLFNLINTFSRDFIEFELNRYAEFSSNKSIKNKLTSSKTFYESLLKTIEQANNNYGVIRIGGGKTYFDNSIGLALYKNNQEKFKEFRKLLGFWKHRSGSISFVEEDSPITRTFYHSQGELYPIGWVIIYPEEQKEIIKNIALLKNKENNLTISTNNEDPIELLKQKFKVTKSKH
jgi:CRISPR-associated protein Csm5